MALNGRPADRGQVDRPALDAEPLATEARQVQQIRDQSLQPVGLARPGQLGGHRVERPAQPGHLVLALHRYLHAGLAGGDSPGGQRQLSDRTRQAPRQQPGEQRRQRRPAEAGEHQAEQERTPLRERQVRGPDQDHAAVGRPAGGVDQRAPVNREGALTVPGGRQRRQHRRRDPRTQGPRPARTDAVGVLAGSQDARGAPGDGQHVGLGLQVARPLGGQLVAHQHDGHADGQRARGHGGQRQVAEHAAAQCHKIAL
jgi:hypothetical protein